MPAAQRHGPRALWVGTGVLFTLAISATAGALHLLVGHPVRLAVVSISSCVAVPLGAVAGGVPALRRHAERTLAATLVVVGLLLLVLASYVVIVVGLAQSPTGSQRGVLALSMVAAVVAALLAQPVRQRLLDAARRISGEPARPVTVALETFGARMTRAVPMDELLLQLAESLRATVGPNGAEIWTGYDGRLELTAAVPELPRPPLVPGKREWEVATHARAQGNAWIEVWFPELLLGREDSLVRLAPIAHLGQLLGLIVVARGADSAPFGDPEDQMLADLARQVGLALHNVRLDSALQTSLAELQARNLELQASRARIVATSDASRRAIERDLHDGAQQHLVALAVKLGLARQVLGESAAASLLDELRRDVQVTIAEVRELAHGIYPPLLRDHGLPEALATAARRSPLSVSVDASRSARFPADTEAAAYFCCLEAMQNAAKYAGPDAHVEVVVTNDIDGLTFVVSDDGAGFDQGVAAPGHGFTNMADRLGAIGGTLRIDSSPGTGTRVCGTVPGPPAARQQPSAW